MGAGSGIVPTSSTSPAAPATGLGGVSLGMPAAGGGSGGQDMSFGITDLFANARMGLGSASDDPVFEGDSGSFSPSYQGGLGGAEWLPPGSEAGMPHMPLGGDVVSGFGGDASGGLEDSMPRYQQF